MITLTKGKASQTFKDELLPAICLQLCGGGYSASQTAKAMALQAKVLTDKAAKIKGVVILKIDSQEEQDK